MRSFYKKGTPPQREVVHVNEVNMHFRYRRSRPETQTTEEEMPDRGPAHRTDFAQRLIDRLAIEKAVRTLPTGYRVAFILHDVEGYKHEEAARMSGHTVGTSKSQLHKARSSLRSVLSRQSPALQT